MIRAAVLSVDEHFHRGIRREAGEAGVRVDLALRSLGELRSTAGLDVIIVHGRFADDLELVRETAGSLPVVVAASDLMPAALVEGPDGWATVRDDSPQAVVAAARAAALGLAVVPAGEDAVFELDDGPEPEDDRGQSDKEPLSTREREVLALVASGATNQQIGTELGISENTVKFHLSGLYAKLGASRRPELVFQAIRRGLVAI